EGEVAARPTLKLGLVSECVGDGDAQGRKDLRVHARSLRRRRRVEHFRIWPLSGIQVEAPRVAEDDLLIRAGGDEVEDRCRRACAAALPRIEDAGTRTRSGSAALLAREGADFRVGVTDGSRGAREVS